MLRTLRIASAFRSCSLSECPADTELEDRRRIELLVCKGPVHRDFHFGLYVDAFADLRGETGRQVQPVPAADENRRSAKRILLPVQPGDTRER
jgi:hypothetical protein